MDRSLNCRFRVRKNEGKVLAKSHQKRPEVKYDRFSSPQKAIADPFSHVTIKRPKFEGLEDATKKYL